jgi:hypothetical protein
MNHLLGVVILFLRQQILFAAPACKLSNGNCQRMKRPCLSIIVSSTNSLPEWSSGP